MKPYQLKNRYLENISKLNILFVSKCGYVDKVQKIALGILIMICKNKKDKINTRKIHNNNKLILFFTTYIH